MIAVVAVARPIDTLGRPARQIRDQAVAQLRAELGGATPPALRFAPGPVPAAGAPEPVERHVAVTPADEDEAASLTSAIDDPALREAVRKAVAASLAAARHDRTV